MGAARTELKRGLMKLIVFGSLLLTYLSHKRFATVVDDKDDKGHLESRVLQEDSENADYQVTLEVNIKPQQLRDVVLQSSYLQAGLEQSVKDFINGDFSCNEETDAPYYYSLDIFGKDVAIARRLQASSNNTCGLTEEEISQGLVCASVVKTCGLSDEDIAAGLECLPSPGKCRGSRKKCKERVETRFADTRKNDLICEATIEDLFKEKLITLSEFEFTITPEVLEDLDGAFDLTYEVDFVPTSTGLEGVADGFNVNANEPEKVKTTCTEAFCLTQRKTFEGIYVNYGLSVDPDRHECAHQGINCNENNLITYMWLGK